MKLLIVFALCALVASAYGASIDVYDGPVYNPTSHLLDDGTLQLDPRDLSNDGNPEVKLPSYRARRFSCDVLSFKSLWVSPNDSACAVRCLAQQRKGGSCQNGVCVCRD